MADKKIPGIHNYCDRWCERCSFGSRCAIYEDPGSIPSEEKDMGNKAFWDRLAINFVKAHEMLKRAAEEAGVDLNAASKEIEESEAKRERVRQESKNHPVSQLSWQYSEAARAWLKTQPGMEEKLTQLRDGLDMGVASLKEAKTKTESIQDCLAVIQWYQSFIHVKLMRALIGKGDGLQLDEDTQRDYDGSAKIALISIDRSMQAWLRLFEMLPEQEDEFLKLLSMLEKLKGMALAEFPDAMAFVRPGFDE
jgi:hypothetical protein